jgi:hypothetical protein
VVSAVLLVMLQSASVPAHLAVRQQLQHVQPPRQLQWQSQAPLLLGQAQGESQLVVTQQVGSQ